MEKKLFRICGISVVGVALVLLLEVNTINSSFQEFIFYSYLKLV